MRLIVAVENSEEGNKRKHAWWRAIHAAERVQHTPTSEIHSQARASHIPSRGGLMETHLVLAEATGNTVVANMSSNIWLRKIDLTSKKLIQNP